MRKMTVCEFAAYCHALSGCSFIYDSANQSAEDSDVSTIMRFTAMKHTLAPAALLFYGIGYSLCLSNIRQVWLCDKRPCVGTVFYVELNSGRRITMLLDETNCFDTTV